MRRLMVLPICFALTGLGISFILTAANASQAVPNRQAQAIAASADIVVAQDNNNGGVSTPEPAPAPTPGCAPAWKRACSDLCDGDYGLLCFFGTVCNPDTHRCEKAAP
jgi:hypothetical protein